MTQINIFLILRVLLLKAGLIILFSSLTKADDSASFKLYQLLERTNSLSARFQQQISYEQGSIMAEQFRGDFLFLKPNYLRWVIEPPAAQEIVSNGDKIWIHDVELEQVIIHDFKNDLLATPSLIFSSSLADINRSYTVTEQQAKEQSQYFVLKANSRSSLFIRLELEFFQGVISQVKLVSDDQINIISFSNTKTNISPAIDLFTFDLPKTAEVLYNYDR